MFSFVKLMKGIKMDLGDFKISTQGMEVERVILIPGLENDVPVTQLALQDQQLVLRALADEIPVTLAELQQNEFADTSQLMFERQGELITIYGYRVVDGNLRLG